MTARLALVAIAAAFLLAVLTAGPAAAHGAPTNPISRSGACGAEGTEQAAAACRAALAKSPRLTVEWDNIRVSGVQGRDREVIPDGELCSGGLAQFSGLDLPRTDWPATTLTAGARHDFSYRGTIPHEGEFRLFVTRPSYDADEPLTWADLEARPFLSVTDPPLTDGSYSFGGELPTGISGRHLIYTVWENSSSSDTYYSCSDVDFENPAEGSEDPAGATEDATATAEPAPGAGSASDAEAADPTTPAPATSASATPVPANAAPGAAGPGADPGAVARAASQVGTGGGAMVPIMIAAAAVLLTATAGGGVMAWRSWSRRER